jgi:hypothetical protein
VNLTGITDGELFGYSVSTAGDLNKDRYDDIVVGAPGYSLDHRGVGHAYLFCGGPSMDNITDVVFSGNAVGDNYGISVSTAGDVNNDGYDDLIIGANSASLGGDGAGHADAFFGGPILDNNTDIRLTCAAFYDGFGHSVSTTGDVNNDGHDEVIVGAPVNNAGGDDAGRAYLYSLDTPGLTVSVGAITIRNRTGSFTGIDKTNDISAVLNEYLRSANPSGNYSYRDNYVDVPISVSATNSDVTLFNLSIIYQYNSIILDFASTLNYYIQAHKDEKDAGGNITIPFLVRSSNGEMVRLQDLRITYDGAPKLVGPIPDLAIDEDTVNNTLLDLYQYFQDDLDPDSALRFSIENATHTNMVIVRISNGRYISADAHTGPANDNWTGIANLRVRCTNSFNLSILSDIIYLIVKNVNDPPVITSTPPTSARAGYDYSYQVTTVDGDNDYLIFSLLRKPDNMTISTGGLIAWRPPMNGTYNVSVSVNDGFVLIYQDFSINVTADKPPWFTSVPATNATVGLEYRYDVRAIDENNYALSFSLVKKPEGMDIDPILGRILWTPEVSQMGDNEITIRVSNSRSGEAEQSFVIKVVSPARPVCIISSPAKGAKVSGVFLLKGTATKVDTDIVRVQIRVDGGEWEDANGTYNWIYCVDSGRLTDGSHAFEAKAYDGSNYSATYSVTLVVDNTRALNPDSTMVLLIVASALLVLVSTGFLYWSARKKPKG